MNNLIKDKNLINEASLESATYADEKDLPYFYKVFNRLENLCIFYNINNIHATQIGINENLFIIKHEDKFNYYVNCSYEGVGNLIKSIEGCISFGSNKRYEVDRYFQIRVFGKKFKTDNDEFTLVDFDTIISGIEALLFQHEIDHNEASKLINKKGIEIDFYVK